MQKKNAMEPVKYHEDTVRRTGFINEPVTVYEDGEEHMALEALISEKPLCISIDGIPYSVEMRTPGAERAHAAGFCLSEGIIRSADEILSIEIRLEPEKDTADVKLAPGRSSEVRPCLNKGLPAGDSAGGCKEQESPLYSAFPCMDKTSISVSQIRGLAESLSEHQELYRKTRSAHAAMILDSSLELLSFAEDVGRHNALDKALGHLLLEDIISSAAVGVLSSRISSELAKKASMAGIEVLTGISRPTASAVCLARCLNMTLACAKKSMTMIFCGKNRVWE